MGASRRVELQGLLRRLPSPAVCDVNGLVALLFFGLSVCLSVVVTRRCAYASNGLVSDSSPSNSSSNATATAAKKLTVPPRELHTS